MFSITFSLSMLEIAVIASESKSLDAYTAELLRLVLGGGSGVGGVIASEAVFSAEGRLCDNVSTPVSYAGFCEV